MLRLEWSGGSSGRWSLLCLASALLLLLPGEGAQQASTRAKDNSIRSVLLGHPPTPAVSNRTTGAFHGATHKKGKSLGQVYPCTNDKECEVGRYCYNPHQGPSSCMLCRRKKKRCHRDGMCCPGNRCNNGICIPVVETILSAHIPALEERTKQNDPLNHKDLGWQNLGKHHPKMPHVKGHEGDHCLRSSDCIDGFCCARHFWTKICKPVLHQGEVCTKQRKKGSHGLEIFQRCDCAKSLTCKVWKDATYSSKSRLHVCQKI
ncbi:hypothetical protein NDU88_005148 [Pleurodeles waltl]|uniref:Dickkopf-related protein 2 n=1 Tax=Pleurodeles waltl TaxID=8319 RepID=A0AAV7X0B8_PLEWA|nr:hypothetical protein NDU88_005148 [Pleurodeles waltl]